MKISRAMKGQSDTLKGICRLVVVMLIAFALISLILLAIGENPVSVIATLFQKSMGNVNAWKRTLRWATSLLLLAAASALCFSGGVLNLGLEGEFIVGAIAVTAVGLRFQHLPGYILLPLCVLAAMLAGCIASGLAGLLEMVFDADIVVVTLMMNYIARFFLQHTIFYTWMYSEKNSTQKATDYVPESVWLKNLLPNSNVTTALIVALVVTVIVAVWLRQTSSGFEIKATDSNRFFARSLGVPIARQKMLLMCASGAIAGLCGGLEVLGIHHRLQDGFVNGLGWDGMIVSMLASNNPILLPFVSVLMGALKVGFQSLEMFSGISSSMADILQGFVIIFITVRFTWNRSKVRKVTLSKGKRKVAISE